MREKHPDGESACGYCLAGKLKKYAKARTEKKKKKKIDVERGKNGREKASNLL